MGVGKTNAISPGDKDTLLCYCGKYRSSTWYTILANDYLSYDATNHIFTVLKKFSGTIHAFGKGTLKENSGGGGLTQKVNITKTSGGVTTTLLNGNAENVGSTTISCLVGDTITVTFPTSGSGTCGYQAGMIIKTDP